MARYKYSTNLGQSRDAAFDKEFAPGETAPWSGIYRCKNCGDEIAHNGGISLPPQNHHRHTTAKGPVVWKLLVNSVSKPKSNSDYLE